jgi:hypothetical protein
MAGKTHKRDSLKGKRFARLLVMDDGKLVKKHWRYTCTCDCGNITHPRSNDLLSGRAKSCGCSFTRHGMSGSPEYCTWMHLRDRCFNTKDELYPLYGGRGITMCQPWADSFLAFYIDMGRRPSEKHRLILIDITGHYEPGNCEWKVPVKIPKPPPEKLYFHLGESKTLNEWASIFKMDPVVLQERLDRGLPFAIAVLRLSNATPQFNRF